MAVNKRISLSGWMAAYAIAAISSTTSEYSELAVACFRFKAMKEQDLVMQTNLELVQDIALGKAMPQHKAAVQDPHPVSHKFPAQV